MNADRLEGLKLLTPDRIEAARLLRDLGRPAEAIAANAGLRLEIIQNWLKTGKWPGPRQGRLFDPIGYSPRPETAQPVATDERDHGLRVFSRAD